MIWATGLNFGNPDYVYTFGAAANGEKGGHPPFIGGGGGLPQKFLTFMPKIMSVLFSY